jgi:site-specific DNA-methyltransferase (adenine-specific)
MKPHFESESATIYHGDRLNVLRSIPNCSVDSVVTDPPYGLRFMNKRWDCDVPPVEVWQECLRVLKPGGYLLSFSGTRTQHRMAVRIEDAGFEIRDMIAWVYGSGFPKSLDVSKAIDKAAGAEREVVGISSVTGARQSRTMDDGNKGTRRTYQNDEPVVNNITAPATDAARQWSGWGTALKPALEPITVARKPLIGTVAENVVTHGTGAINVEACRVTIDASVDDPRLGGAGQWKTDKAAQNVYKGGYEGKDIASSPLGRWPANLIHDGSDEVLSCFPQSSGQQGDVTGSEPSHTGTANCYGEYGRVPAMKRGDSGSAARFFYCSKASNKDRNDGMDGAEDKVLARSNQAQAEASRGSAVDKSSGAYNKPRIRKNNHPTVKPTDLMRYLCRLVTPPGGIVIDPHMGSGSTGRGAILEGFRFIGIDNEFPYCEIAIRRILASVKEKRSKLF